MRLPASCVLLGTCLLLACSSSSEDPGADPGPTPSDDAGPTPSEDASGPDAGADAEPNAAADAEAPPQKVHIESPGVPVAAHQESIYCYYFRTPNSEPLGIRRWAVTLSEGVKSAVVFTTPTDRFPPGTLSFVDCGVFAPDADRADWVIGAYGPSAELTTPPDDGTGKPVAFELPISTSGFILMHLLNLKDVDIEAKVEITGEALPFGTRYTKTAPLLTYHDAIAVPPETQGHVESLDCEVPAGAKFWHMTTRTHKHAVNASVKDGATTVMESTDWAKPEAKLWASPFYSFSSGTMTTACTYDNAKNLTIRTGNSVATQEQCIGVAHFFPALEPIRCRGPIP